MNLKTDSFIYKWVLIDDFRNHLNFKRSVSLCVLFWMIVSSAIFKAAVGLLGLLVATFILLPYIYAFDWWLLGGNIESISLELMQVSTIINIAIGTFILFGLGIEKYNESDIRVSNFIPEYVKAKKEKVCPIIKIDSSNEREIYD